MALYKKLAQQFEEQWPYLESEGYEVKSIKTERYNCIAFAADDPSLVWWPHPDQDVFWPIEMREVSLRCFIEAFKTLDYAVCENGLLESGFEKIVIYMFEGLPTHAAKQLPDGRWKSKLGFEEDIEHNTTKALEDDTLYGSAVQYMKRQIK